MDKKEKQTHPEVGEDATQYGEFISSYFAFVNRFYCHWEYFCTYIYACKQILTDKLRNSGIFYQFKAFVVDMEFRLDYQPTEVEKGYFEGTAVPAAAPPSLPDRLKRGETMYLLPSLQNLSPLLDTEEHQNVALQEHYTFD